MAAPLAYSQVTAGGGPAGSTAAACPRTPDRPDTFPKTTPTSGSAKGAAIASTQPGGTRQSSSVSTTMGCRAARSPRLSWRLLPGTSVRRGGGRPPRAAATASGRPARRPRPRPARPRHGARRPPSPGPRPAGPADHGCRSRRTRRRRRGRDRPGPRRGPTTPPPSRTSRPRGRAPPPRAALPRPGRRAAAPPRRRTGRLVGHDGGCARAVPRSEPPAVAPPAR